MDKPELNTEKLIEAAMTMREATTAMVQLESMNSTNPKHQQSINLLAGVIAKQQNLLSYLLEHYIKLGELLDQIYDHIDVIDDPMLKGQPAEGQFTFQEPMGIKTPKEAATPQQDWDVILGKQNTFPDGCVCGSWSNSKNEVHLITAPCFMVEED